MQALRAGPSRNKPVLRAPPSASALGVTIEVFPFLSRGFLFLFRFSLAHFTEEEQQIIFFVMETG